MYLPVTSTQTIVDTVNSVIQNQTLVPQIPDYSQDFINNYGNTIIAVYAAVIFAILATCYIIICGLCKA